MRKKSNLFQNASYDALVFVYDQHLSNPFSDVNAPRGPYIDGSGVYCHYPANQQVRKDSTEVYRPNHGLAHNVRVTAKVSDVIKLYADSENNTNANSRKWFEALNTEDEKTKLEIVGSFYVACRESEAGFSPEPSSPYQRYRDASSNAFYDYAKTLKKSDEQTPLFTEAELQLYKTVLRDPYFDKSADAPALLGSNEFDAKKAAAKAVLSSCHALDLARCFHSDKMGHKIWEVIDPFGKFDANRVPYQRSRVFQQFVRSEIQHILTGNKITSSFDLMKCSFQEKIVLEKRFLFRLCGTHPDIAIRCVSLSHHIDNADIANRLSISFNRYAMRGADALKQFLTRIENCFSENSTESLNSILLEEKVHLRNTSAGRIFKTIRSDDLDFWDEFAKELIDPSADKPELRGTKDKNTDIRLPFTVKLKNGEYKVVPTSKEEKRKIPGEEYNEADKKKFSRHQSTSYSNYQAGYNPPYFGHNVSRSELLVGVSFAPEDCQLKRIMMYDLGTIGRPYDFQTKKEAKKFIIENLASGMYHTSLASLQVTGLTRGHNKHNEVMAKLQWTRNSSITVFSDNLESRLLAQLRALDLKNRFEKKYSGQTVTIPITIYPEFLPYTTERQAEDKIAAQHDSQLQHYFLLEKFFLERSRFSLRDYQPDTIRQALILSKKLNKELYKNLLNLIIAENLDLTTIIHNVNDFINVMQHFSSDKFKVACDTLKDTLSVIIKNVEDFYLLVQAFEGTDKIGLILNVVDFNKLIDGNSHTFIRVFQTIPEQYRDNVLDSLSFANIIQNEFDFRYLLDVVKTDHPLIVATGSGFPLFTETQLNKIISSISDRLSLLLEQYLNSSSSVYGLSSVNEYIKKATDNVSIENCNEAELKKYLELLKCKYMIKSHSERQSSCCSFFCGNTIAIATKLKVIGEMQSMLQDKQIRPLSSAAELALADMRFIKVYERLKILTHFVAFAFAYARLLK